MSQRPVIVGPDQKRAEDLEWRAHVRAEDVRWREESREREFAWRQRTRAEDAEWREETRRHDAEVRAHESRLATRRFALLAAAQSLGPGSTPEEAFALAARYERWITDSD